MSRLSFAIALIGLLVAVNFAVSYRVLRSSAYGVGQKVAQVAIVWLLPIIGLLLVWAFLREPSDSASLGTVDGLGTMGPLDLFTTNQDIVGGSSGVANAPDA